jgi:hypothetical protein
MKLGERRWNAALAEHESVVREFLEVCERCAPSEWHFEPTPGHWSTAAVALHVCRTYEMARHAMLGGPSMRLPVSKPYSWLLRTFMLPAMLATKRFLAEPECRAKWRPTSRKRSCSVRPRQPGA